MNADTFFIDVNIPMYAAGAEHPNRAACVWVMTAIARSNLSAAIDVEIIQEIFHRYGSLRMWDVADKMATNILRIVPTVLPVTPQDIYETLELARRYGVSYNVPARDLIHAAVMGTNGLSTIISTDSHFDRLDHIRRIHPQSLMDHFR